ncbi:MAG: alpha/beta fold hydrolase, partial [Planctomycetota bacterium]
RVATLMRPKLFAEGTPDAVVEKTVAEISAADPAAIAAAQRAMAARPDSTDRLPLIEKPTLVVVGEHDAISTAEEMRGVAEAIPGADYSLIEGAGHMAPAERPDAVNSALAAFVRSL